MRAAGQTGPGRKAGNGKGGYCKNRCMDGPNLEPRYNNNSLATIISTNGLKVILG